MRTSTTRLLLRQPPLLRPSPAPRLLRVHPARHSSTSRAVPPDFYALFPRTLPSGAPPKGPFHVDGRALRQEYLSLQQQAHPDVASYARPAAGLPSSAYISRAYQTLLSPLLRAQYLLSLHGIDVAEDEHMKVYDQGLLLEVVELQERLEEADDEEEVEQMQLENDGRMATTVERLEQAFGEEDLEAAKAEAVRLRYWENVDQSLKKWEKGKPIVLVH